MLRSSLRVFGDAASPLQSTLRPTRLAARFTSSAHFRALEDNTTSTTGITNDGATAGPSTSNFKRATSSTTSPTPTSSSRSSSKPSSVLPGSRPIPLSLIPYHLRANKEHRLYVQATRNNTILTLTDPNGNVLHGTSGGTVGFKNAARSGYEAAYQAALSMFKAIDSRRSNVGRASVKNFNRLELIWKGFGEGRDAVFRALLAAEGTETRDMIKRMSDATRIKIGGVRPKKRRNY